jgi:hypothetical protein
MQTYMLQAAACVLAKPDTLPQHLPKWPRSVVMRTGLGLSLLERPQTQPLRQRLARKMKEGWGNTGRKEGCGRC